MARHWYVVGMALAAAPVAGTAHAASNAREANTIGPWEPYKGANSFVLEPGRACTFRLVGELLDDQEMARTLATDAAGNVTIREVVGAIVFRYFNESTGRSVVRHVDGHAWLFYHPDHTETWVTQGPFAFAVTPSGRTTTTPSLGLGGYIASGTSILEVHGKNGHITWAGPMENICETLGDARS
ncbi:hypothetical protein LVJ94_49300 [Pendulispora rubella]|uniref:Uncharacterized protein n=1 Tax=Pendulispora rubella TaxID=2741070 RepID=A0ABZ2L2A4_9BACT